MVQPQVPRDEGERIGRQTVFLLELDKGIWPEEKEYVVMMNSLLFQHTLNLDLKLGIILGKFLYDPMHGKIQ